MNRLFALLAAIPVAFCLTKPSDEVVVVAEVTRNFDVVGVNGVSYVEATVAIEEIQVQEETTELTEEYVSEKCENWNTETLTARKGYIIDSPCGGSETWYPDAPVGAVQMMEELYGFRDLEMTVREEDGVRILSGIRPNGDKFEELVVVAADVRDVNDRFERNINGIFERGDIVETSLGTGIVVDYSLRAVNERKANGSVHIDIATAWK